MAKTTAKSSWDTIIKYIRDIIYVSLFLIAVSSSIVGWAKAGRTESAESQALKSTVENNTSVMIELKEELKNINIFLLNQRELNGRFEEFMDNEKRKNQ
jgi:hypothetical protein